MKYFILIGLMFSFNLSWGAEFGYHTIGATNQSTSEILCTQFTTPVGGGTITAIFSYIDGDGGGGINYRAAVYSDSGGSPNSLLASASVDTAIAASPLDWYESDLSYTFAGNIPIWLCDWSSGGRSTAHDTGTSTQTDHTSSFTYPSFPATYSSTGQLAWVNSIYATYTTATITAPSSKGILIIKGGKMSIRGGRVTIL